MSNEPKGISSGQTLTQPPSTAASVPAKPANPRPNKRDELRLLVNSHHPIIAVETPEEERLEQLLLDVAAELAVPLYTWSVTSGLAKAHGAPIYNTDSPEQAVANIALIQGDAIFLLKDFARYCDNDRVCRRLRELAEKFNGQAVPYEQLSDHLVAADVVISSTGAPHPIYGGRLFEVG